MKQTLKKQIIKKRNSLTEQEVKEKSKKIIGNLKALEEFQKAKNILFYVSVNNEVDTHEIIKELLKAEEKNIIVPYTMRGKPRIFLSKLKDFTELEPRSFGILEPKEKYIKGVDKGKLDLIIVPGIAFDKNGHRIGYGYGYYDRFLKTINEDTVKIGLAYKFQIIEKIPEEEHDVPLNIIVMAKEIIRVE
ncbi:5-formyltetrahydrofolate cyclo-ligase [Candidatus Woesearchaeota archaeon]|nr:5-formyltetrahydrofolate cyclo-ligase [Candidatus Woesearchaeota archaeon]